MLYWVGLTFESVDEILKCDLFIVLHKVALTFALIFIVDEILIKSRYQIRATER